MMLMQKAYSRINWENYPSYETPINETNLNRMSAALDEVDNNVVALDALKASKEEVATVVADVSFEESTGIITVTKKNGAVITIDTKMEKIAVNFDYNRETQQIILTLIDGTKQYIDLSALVTQYEFLNSDTVTFIVMANGSVKAEVLDGSITDDKLDPNYLALIKVEVAKAEESASNAEKSSVLSESWAVGGTGTREGEDTNNSKYYSDVSFSYKEDAKTFSESAKDSVNQISKKLEMVTFDVDDNGNLIYTDNSSYVFSVDDNGYLNWEVA